MFVCFLGIGGDFLIAYFAATDLNGATLRQRRVAIGIALSLALHALLLSAWRSNPARTVNAQPEPPRSIAVWIRPLPEPPPAEPPVTAVAPTAPQARTRPHKVPRPALAVRPRPEAPAQQPLSVVQQPSRTEPPPAAPHFDRDAARQFARRIASERDPAKADTAVGQFPEKALQTESRAERAIASAKRRDCKDGIPGGLLAPLVLLLDKKDSGCKW
jgi:type IV secretory pathway VirB10-like protein